MDTSAPMESSERQSSRALTWGSDIRTLSFFFLSLLSCTFAEESKHQTRAYLPTQGTMTVVVVVAAAVLVVVVVMALVVGVLAIVGVVGVCRCCW